MFTLPLRRLYEILVLKYQLFVEKNATLQGKWPLYMYNILNEIFK